MVRLPAENHLSSDERRVEFCRASAHTASMVVGTSLNGRRGNWSGTAAGSDTLPYEFGTHRSAIADDPDDPPTHPQRRDHRGQCGAVHLTVGTTRRDTRLGKPPPTKPGPTQPLIADPQGDPRFGEIRIVLYESRSHRILAHDVGDIGVPAVSAAPIFWCSNEFTSIPPPQSAGRFFSSRPL